MYPPENMGAPGPDFGTWETTTDHIQQSFAVHQALDQLSKNPAAPFAEYYPISEHNRTSQ